MRDAALRGWFNQETHELFTGFPVGPGDVLADIGCGLGGHAQFCARQGASVILVDADASRIAKARAKIENIPGHAPFEAYVSECNPLPIKDAAATRVLCTEVIEHVDSPDELMAEMARIGKPGALYLFTCPDPAAEALQKRVAKPGYFEKPNHIRIVQHEEFTRMVENAGLMVVSRHSSGFFWSMWLTFFWSIDAPFDNLGEKSFQLPGHPVLDAWLRTWQNLLDQPNGNNVKQALDDLMPKNQIIIARKP